MVVFSLYWLHSFCLKTYWLNLQWFCGKWITVNVNSLQVQLLFPAKMLAKLPAPLAACIYNHPGNPIEQPANKDSLCKLNSAPNITLPFSIQLQYQSWAKFYSGTWRMIHELLLMSSTITTKACSWSWRNHPARECLFTFFLFFGFFFFLHNSALPSHSF